MTEGLRTVAVAFLGLGAGFTWYAVRSSMVPPTSPDRLVAELRLAQFAALLLTLVSGAYIGFAVSNEAVVGVGLDIALAVLDVAHRPGVLPEIAPRWYLIGCAVYDVFIGALCYLPILRR